MPVSLPKLKILRPSILAGQKNGRIDPKLLESTTFGGALAIRPAARAFRAFAAVIARPAGIDPRNVGGYRNLAGQWQIFGGSAARYEPCSLAQWLITPSSRRKTFPAAMRAEVSAYLKVVIPDSTYWRKIAFRSPTGAVTYPATAAVPSTSNHGDGLALDVAEELDGDPSPESLSAKFRDLLIAHGPRFGLTAETDAEPWHWTYYAGDTIPAAVLAFENGIVEPDYPLPTFKLGDSGAQVLKFQAHNNYWHAAGACPDKLEEDGQAGPLTIGAVRKWQGALHVPITGVYDVATAGKYRAVLVDIARAKQ